MYNDGNDGVIDDDDCNQYDQYEPQRRGANVDMTQRNPTNDQAEVRVTIILNNIAG